MLKIWGRITSINVRKVVWAAQELGLAFERIDAGLSHGIVRTPDYLAKNPNALVPLIEDGDFVLWESNVIVRYLAARYGDGTLYPRDLHQRFDADQGEIEENLHGRFRNGGLRHAPVQLDPAVVANKGFDQFARLLHRDHLAITAGSAEGEAEEAQLVRGNLRALLQQLEALAAHLRVFLVRQQFQAIGQGADRAQHVMAQPRT